MRRSTLAWFVGFMTAVLVVAALPASAQADVIEASRARGTSSTFIKGTSPFNRNNKLTLSMAYDWSYGPYQYTHNDTILNYRDGVPNSVDPRGTASRAVPTDSYIFVTITNPPKGQPLTIYNQNPALAGRQDNVLTKSSKRNTTFNGMEVAVRLKAHPAGETPLRTGPAFSHSVTQRSGVQPMHVNIRDVDAVEVSPGVVLRVLLRRDQSVPGGLDVTHHTLTGGEVVFDAEGVEHQHYIVAGCAMMSSRFFHSETAIFVPGGSRFGERPQHALAHAGESELRILTASYRTPHPNFPWAKTRSRNLYQAPVNLGQINGQQLITEEEHALMGALRMHAIDVQTHAPLMAYPDHRNPEEIIYVLRGTGDVLSGGERHQMSPGSLVYTKEGDVHGIFNTSDTLPLQYVVLEFIEQDRMWTQR